ncbi:MAG: hypothetical protein RLZZ262_816 [Bacteroidota bacterium]
MKKHLLSFIMIFMAYWSMAQFTEQEFLLDYDLVNDASTYITKDFDNDGDLDVIAGDLDVINHYSFIVYYNNGSGVFDQSEVIWRSPSTSTLWGVFEIPIDFDVLDINADGWRDIVMVTQWGTQFYSSIDNSMHIYVIEFEERGVYVPAYEYTTPYVHLTEKGLHFNDIDNDGDLDIAVVHNTATPAAPNWVDKWILKTGGMTWITLLPAVTSHCQPNIDVDDDGLLDLLVTSFSDDPEPYAVIRRNLGGGNFGSYQFIEMSSESTQKAVYDVNADGLPDIIEAVPGWNNTPTQMMWKANLDNFNFGNANPWFTLESGFDFVAFADYDHDTDIDLIVQELSTGNIMGKANLAGTGFAAPVAVTNHKEVYVAQSLGAVRCVSPSADFDGDGELDLLVSEKNNGCNMKTAFSFQENLIASTMCSIEGVGGVRAISGQFDADSNMDMLTFPDASSAWGQTALADIAADGTIGDFIAVNSNLTPVYIDYYTVLDLDDDSVDEILVHTNTGFIMLGFTNGVLTNKGTQPNVNFYNYGVQEFPTKTDFNGDGRWDLFMGAAYNTVWINNGNLSFTVIDNVMPNRLSVSAEPLFTDVDENGTTDIVYAKTTGLCYVSINASNVLQTPVQLGPNGVVPLAILGDIHTDGGFICQSNVIVGSYSFFRNSGDGSFNLIYPLGSFSTTGLNADFDNDGAWEYINPDRTMWDWQNGAIEIDEVYQNDYYFDWYDQELSSDRFLRLNDLNQDGFIDIIYQYGVSNNVMAVRWNRIPYGCLDPNACNYNDEASIDDGSCCFSGCGCTDAEACNYSNVAVCSNGTCTYEGCTDPTACNFDPLAGCDDGSCQFSPNFEISMTTELNGSDPIYPIVWFVAADNPGQVDNTWLNLPDYLGVMSTDELTGITTIDFGCVPYDCYQMKLITQFPFDEDDEVFVQLSQNGTVIHYDSYVPYLLLSDPDPNADTYIMNSAFAIEWLCFCPEEANTGCLNQFAFNYDAQADCNDGRCTFSVSGRVFFDENQNGIFDNNDYGLPFQEVTLYPEEITIITNDDGFYYTELPWGTFYLVHTPDPNYPFYTTPDSYAITTGLGPLVNKDFGLSPTEPLSAICVDFYPSWYFCNYWVNFNLCFRNDGNVPIDGILTVELDSLITQINEITPIDSIVGNMVYFSYQDLMPGQMFLYDIELWTPTVDYQGTNIVNTANVYGYDSDGVLVATGQRTRIIEHLCSYDPNDKQADPMGYTESHFVEDGTAIEYVVRFQNTGTAPAYYVRVEDMIDENLDIDSFEFVANSHSVIVSLNEETRKLIFYHNAIMLPDSFSDEPGSHGLVSYRIRLKEGLQPGTIINNTAYIYFDFNDPVITNTTLHTVFECDDYASSFNIVENDNCGQSQVILASNSAWTESYAWMMDGVQIGNEPNVTITDPGEHTIELVVVNPLCGLRNSQQTIVLEEPIVASILGEDAHLCDNESVTFTASNTTAALQWTLDGTNIGTGTSVDVTSPGLLMLTSTVDDCVLQSSVQITSTSMTVIPPIQQNQNILSVESTSGATYQWYLGGEAIANATANAIEITESGLYTLTATIADCVLSQDIDAQYISVSELTSTAFTVYPNPTNGDFVVKQAMGTTIDVWLVNALGQRLKAWKLTPGQHQLTITDLPAGMYTLETNANARVVLVKI